MAENNIEDLGTYYDDDGNSSQQEDLESFSAVAVNDLGRVIVEVLAGFSSSLRDMAVDMDCRVEIAKVNRWADLIDSSLGEIIDSITTEPGAENLPQMLAVLRTPETPNDDNSD
ncbi:hypothetical protein ml_34 [Mollivirus sibericum]|uniref:hypothetical protein n=1 Tax=Mollivirus sibericum TaxID=1678078 RepID=UPI0006B2DFFA|nr:hypothetical protein ml_34 [Mollivirus sibericum]ALD61836.1 hypothetical protein ml_34 [Mollivirus sibericum]